MTEIYSYQNGECKYYRTFSKLDISSLEYVPKLLWAIQLFTFELIFIVTRIVKYKKILFL